MKGYYNNEQATKAAIDENGWLHTGDLAIMDDEGYCKIVGRLKDMIIRGGENIYPREIEEFLYTCPDISEIQVFGIPDEKFGEEIAAFVKLKVDATTTPEGIRRFCKGKIASFKIRISQSPIIPYYNGARRSAGRYRESPAKKALFVIPSAARDLSIY